ncbi:hypothetical protein C8J56DRAFT_1031435 [Mycena floridula]|nr:hypothetical protein C8J56DRAFT_1031435 [Mycena floridula]
MASNKPTSDDSAYPAYLETLAETLGPAKICQLSKTIMKRPDKHQDRIGWNNHFEKMLRLDYDAEHHANIKPFDVVNNIPISTSFDLCHSNQQPARLTKEVMTRETIFITAFIRLIHFENLEAEWEALDHNRKEELVLEVFTALPAWLTPRMLAIIVPK